MVVISLTMSSLAKINFPQFSNLENKISRVSSTSVFPVQSIVTVPGTQQLLAIISITFLFLSRYLLKAFKTLS